MKRNIERNGKYIKQQLTVIGPLLSVHTVNTVDKKYTVHKVPGNQTRQEIYTSGTNALDYTYINKKKKHDNYNTTAQSIPRKIHY